ncbi:MAG: AAA family ATPase [Bulleidia sp.]
MKHLYLIGGPMGIGKTTVCHYLKKQLNSCVFLDGDWCWDMDPFVVNDETRTMVMDNICFQLNRFLHCTILENVVFCRVMHQQKIIDDILSRLDTEKVQVHVISLTCDPDGLVSRIQKDIAEGKRDSSVIERTLSYLPLYENVQSYKVSTTGRKIEQIAEEIIGH